MSVHDGVDVASKSEREWRERNDLRKAAAAADPLIFMVGPPEGWRIVAITFFPRLPKPGSGQWSKSIYPPEGRRCDGCNVDVLPFDFPSKRFKTLLKSTFAM